MRSPLEEHFKQAMYAADAKQRLVALPSSGQVGAKRSFPGEGSHAEPAAKTPKASGKGNENQRERRAPVVRYFSHAPHEVVELRPSTLRTWLARKSMRTLAGLVGLPADDHLKVLLQGKDLDLWKSMLVESQFPEPQIVDEVASGFSLVGLADESSLFPVDLKLAE
eukprot:3090038-Amphidinium_carterae.1